MIYNNLNFDGQHCLADMGLIYVPASTKPIIAPQTVDSYIIGGTSGTIAYGDQHTATQYQRTGIFYPADDIANEREAQRLWRRVAQWLGVGRRKLIFDSEPDKYIIAEVQQMDNDEYGWIDGGLQVTWLCQPYHWAEQPDELTLTLPGSASPLKGMQSGWYVETSLPAPVDAVVINQGAVTVTGINLTVNGKTVAFEGVELLQDERLEISMMTPIGAVIRAADGTVRSAMDCMTSFEALQTLGVTSVTVAISYAEEVEGGSALLKLMGHGCWR